MSSAGSTLLQTEPGPLSVLKVMPSTDSATKSLERLAQVLRTVCRTCPDLPVVAIRWMHVSHPLHKLQEALLGSNGCDPTPQGYTFLLRRLAQSVVYAVYLAYRVAHLRLLLWREMARIKRQRFHCIAKTCCFGPGRPLGDDDFYLGDLQAQMAKRGVKMLLLCGDVRNGNWTTFARGHTALDPHVRLPELCLAHPCDLISVWAQQLRACVRLRRHAARTEDALLKQVYLLASQDCLAPDTAQTSLYYGVGRRAVRTWHPRAFLTLYEGHAWEHCLWRGVAIEDSQCQKVGYQHTVLFPESLGVISPDTEGVTRTLPDIVLCLGQGPLELMKSGHQRYQTRLMCFGSFRSQRVEAEHPTHASRRTILVTPEGLATEVKALFTFAYACSQRMPSYTFVLRCHPEIPMKKARELVSIDLEAQPNIVLSERRIEDDFARAGVLLYRGSSAVMYAILHGLLPLYVHQETLRDRDPLYALKAWRRICTSPQDVVACMARYDQASADQFEDEWRSAVSYVKEYTGPATNERIEAFLQSVGLARESL